MTTRRPPLRLPVSNAVRRGLGLMGLLAVLLGCPSAPGPLDVVVDPPTAPPIPGMAATATTPPGLVPADASVGLLQGVFSVDGNGAATYQIDLEVPPGTGGVEPELALTYSSHRDNGLLGMGWAINGISNVSRCNATEAVNGFTAAVDFTWTDRFCLDGQPLVAVSGEYGRDGTEYRTRRDNWTRVVSRGTCGQGPCWLEAHNKDGAILRFGFTTGATGSRILATGRTDGAVRVWSLDRYTDLNGNYTAVTYANDEGLGAYRPARIDYTGNDRTGLAPQRSVRFAYELRPDRITGYSGGSGYQTLYRMTRIETWVGSQLVKAYVAGYDQGTTTDRSRIRSLSDCTTATPSPDTCLPATTFQATDPARGFVRTSERSTSRPVQSTLAILPMEITGDGRTDVVQAWSSGGTLHLETYLSQGDGLGSGRDQSTGVTAADLGLIGMDVDGDGLGDVVMPSDNGGLELRTFLADGTGGFDTDVSTRTGQSVDHLSFVPADVNGDGRQDLVQVYDAGGDVAFRVYPAIGGGRFGSAATSGSSQSTDNLGFLPLDFDGDGRIDIVQPRADGDRLVFVLYHSTGRAFGPGQVIETGRSGSDVQVTAGDVNGDGKADLVLLDLSGTSVQATPYFSTGTTFRSASTSTLGSVADNVSVLSAQLDSDSRSDLVQALDVGGDVRLVPYYGTGDRFTAGTPFTTSLPSEHAGLQMIDLAGDNRQDVLDPRDVSGNLRLSTVLGPTGQPDLVTEITNGLGGAITVEHRPMSDPSVYRPGTGAVYPVRDVTSPMPLVASYTNADGRGNSYDFDYFYQRGRAGAGGMGWLGFEVVRLTQPSDGRFSEVTYDQAWPANGLVVKNAFYDHNQVLLGNTELTYEDVAPSALAAVGVHQYVRVFESYSSFDQSSGGARLYTLEKAYAYDDSGNVELISYLGRRGTTDDDRYTCVVYDNDHQAWRLGYAQRQKVTRTLASCQSFLTDPHPTWDGATDLRYERWEYDERQNLVAHGQWDDSHDVWLETSTTVDDYGNRLTRTDPAGFTTRFTYEDTYHTFPETITGPPNQAGETLVDSYRHEPYFGQTVEQTDANGNVWQWQVDTLGQMVAAHAPDPDGNTVRVETHTWGRDAEGTFQRTSTRPEWDAADDPANWYWEKTYFDGMDRQYRTETRGETADTAVVEEIRFDEVGQVSGNSLPHFLDQGPQWISTEYDVYNRPTTITQPDGTTQKLDYQLGTLKVYRTDAYGTADARTEILQFDAYGQPASRALANGEVYYYRHSLMGELLEIRTVPELRRVLFTYDSVGRLRSKTTDNSGTTEYHFDDKGRMTGETDADGDSLTYTYDGLGRILTVTSTTETGSVTTVNTYDGATANGKGELTHVAMTDPAVGDYTYRLGYHPGGETATVRLDVDGETYAYAMDFNPLGQLSGQSYPDGARLAMAYGLDSQIDTLSLATDGTTFTPYVTYGDYSPGGIPGSERYHNGVETRRSFYSPDVATGKLRQVTATSTATGDTLYDAVYDWNRLDFVTDVENQRNPAASTSYSYDTAKLGFLTTADGPFGTETFDYDQLGNRTAHDGVDYTYPEPNDKFSAFGPGTSATWTDSGHLESLDDGRRMLRFTYDAHGRMVRARQDGVEGEGVFVYDFAGNRLLHQPIGETTRHWSISSDYEIADYGERRLATKYIDGQFGRAVAVTTDLDSPAQARLVAHHEHLMAIRLAGDSAPLATLGHRLAAAVSHPTLLAAVASGRLQALLAVLLVLGGWLWLWRRSASLAPHPGRPKPPGTGILAHRRHAGPLVPVLVAALVFPLGVPAGATLQPGANGPGNPTVGTDYFVHDLVGSVVAVTDPAGQSTAQVGYYPFGHVDESSSTGTDDFRPKYSGKGFDLDVGLYDFDHRAYQPLVGRFTTPDPAEQYINPYVLGSDNPTSMVDPTGEFALLAAIVIGAIIGAYMGAAAVNHDYNPAHWDWTSGKTYAGLLGGAVIGAVGGAIIEVAATAGVAAGLAGAVLVGAGENAAYTAMGGGSAKDILISAAEGAAFGFLFGAAGAGLGRLASRFGRTAGRAVAEGGEGAERGAARALRSACSSFLPGTRVLEDGGELTPIDEIQVGDRVQGWERPTDRSDAHPVLATLDGTTDTVTRIETASGAVIEATPGHMVRAHGRGWIRADQLHPGLALTDPDGAPIPLASVETVPLATPSPVYNLSVDRATSYYVSAAQALVRNVRGACLVAKGTRRPGWRTTVKRQVFRDQTVTSGRYKNYVKSAVSRRYLQRNAKVWIGKRNPRRITAWQLDHKIPYKYLLKAADETKMTITWKNMIEISNYRPNLRYMTMAENVSHRFEPTAARGRAGARAIFKALGYWQ